MPSFVIVSSFAAICKAGLAAVGTLAAAGCACHGVQTAEPGIELEHTSSFKPIISLDSTVHITSFAAGWTTVPRPPYSTSALQPRQLSLLPPLF